MFFHGLHAALYYEWQEDAGTGTTLWSIPVFNEIEEKQTFYWHRPKNRIVGDLFAGLQAYICAYP